MPYHTDDDYSELKAEIADLGDATSIQLSILDGDDQTIIGQANIDLWVMIEDSCNILRQEIDIWADDLSHVIGSAVIDCRGHRLLTKCSTKI